MLVFGNFLKSYNNGEQMVAGSYHMKLSLVHQIPARRLDVAHEKVHERGSAGFLSWFHGVKVINATFYIQPAELLDEIND